MKEVKLSQGFVARVSDEDFERVSKFKWTAHKGSSSGSRWYAVRNAYMKTETGKRLRVWIRLHRFIMDLPPGTLAPEVVVDHADGDGFNCERSNLEVITHAENARRAALKRAKNCEPFL